MEKLEVIKWLKSIKDKYIHGGDESYDSKRAEAIDCAIAALGGAVKTNADRIRAMSDEELANFLRKETWKCERHATCKECPRWIGDCCLPLDEWLQQPAEVGT